jgi:hypothetical protein
MRRLRLGLGLMLLMALALVGCANRDIALRPPKRPDELVLPPVADGRFSSPPRYPEHANDELDPSRQALAQGGTPNLGAMNSMGGMGGGGMGMGGMGMGGMGMGGMGMGSMLGGYGR